MVRVLFFVVVFVSVAVVSVAVAEESSSFSVSVFNEVDSVFSDSVDSAVVSVVSVEAALDSSFVSVDVVFSTEEALCVLEAVLFATGVLVVFAADVVFSEVVFVVFAADGFTETAFSLFEEVVCAGKVAGFVSATTVDALALLARTNVFSLSQKRRISST